MQKIYKKCINNNFFLFFFFYKTVIWPYIFSALAYCVVCMGSCILINMQCFVCNIVCSVQRIMYVMCVVLRVQGVMRSVQCVVDFRFRTLQRTSWHTFLNIVLLLVIENTSLYGCVPLTQMAEVPKSDFTERQENTKLKGGMSQSS